MARPLVLTPEDAAAIGRLIDKHCDEIEETEQRIAADLVAAALTSEMTGEVWMLFQL